MTTDFASVVYDAVGAGFSYVDPATGVPTSIPSPGGTTMRSGSGAPSSGLGSNGDFYLDEAGSALYGPKAAGAWGGAVLSNGVPELISASIYGAVGDGKIMSDGVVGAASTAFSSASTTFSAADVGKSILIAGAGAAGAALSTTISAVTPPHAATLAVAATTGVSSARVNYGTNNSTAIAAAIAAAKLFGGRVLLGPGTYLSGGIDMTNSNSIALEGACSGINAPGLGTVILPLGSTNMIDMTGTGGPVLANLQIGTDSAVLSPNIGLLTAQNNAGGFSSRVTLRNVFVCGNFNVAAWYNYGVGDSYVLGSQFWNKIGSSKFSVVMSRDNVNSVSSDFATIATTEYPVGNWEFDSFEVHDYKASGATTGGAIRLRGTGQMKFVSGLIDSSSSNGNVLIENSGGGIINTGISWDTCSFYTEGATLGAYALNTVGEYHNPEFRNCSWGTAAYFTGSGAFTSDRGIPLSYAMQPSTSNGGSSTLYFSIGQNGTVEFDVGLLLQSRLLLSGLSVQANGNVSAGTHTLAVMKNGSATALTAALTGGVPTGADTTHYAVFEKGDRIAMRDVASGGATNVRFTAGIVAIPF